MVKNNKAVDYDKFEKLRSIALNLLSIPGNEHNVRHIDREISQPIFYSK